MDRLSSFHFELPAFAGFVSQLQRAPSSSCKSAAFTHLEWEEAPWRKQKHNISEKKHSGAGQQGNLNRVFWGLFVVSAALGNGEVGAALVQVLREVPFAPSLCRGLGSEPGVVCWGEGGMRSHEASFPFWISDHFGQSCIFWGMHNRRGLWIMAPLLN